MLGLIFLCGSVVVGSGLSGGACDAVEGFSIDQLVVGQTKRSGSETKYFIGVLGAPNRVLVVFWVTVRGMVLVATAVLSECGCRGCARKETYTGLPDMLREEEEG